MDDTTVGGHQGVSVVADPGRRWPPGVSALHERFTARAGETPEAVAVVDGDREVTYRELTDLAGAVAAGLAAGGRGRGSVVALEMSRGTDLIAALLGTWMAGAVYLPLDPDLPAARRSVLLAEAGVEVVLTAEAVRAFAASPRRVPAAEVGPADAAYVMFTSGSTGRPKGVVISHGGIANRVGWTVTTHGLGAADSVLQKTSLGFDASVWELVAPLVSGGRVVLAPAGAERDPAAMVRAVIRHRVTVLQVVPSVLRLLVTEPSFAACHSLRLLFSAGEVLHAELCQQVWGSLALEVWNTYGPTECSIDATAHRCEPRQTAGPVPIGRPISGVRVLVLDPAGQPTPIGIPGEVHIGGAGVGLGYLGRPDLTRERFLSDPWGEQGDRLYRTGDRGRWRSDGVLEYLGRFDDQVKITGVRVEPAEVEAAVLAYPGVRACAVLGIGDERGDTRLASWVVGGPDLDPAELRTFLRARLPAAFVPSDIAGIDALPLNTAGKVDRAALRELHSRESPGGSRPRPEERPRTPLEERVAALWNQVLGMDVGINDNFLNLSGASLDAARLVSMISQEFSVPLAIRTLFDQPTVAGLAQALADAGVDPDRIFSEPTSSRRTNQDSR